MELLHSCAGWQFAIVIRSGEKRAALFNPRQDPIVRIPFFSPIRRTNPLSDPRLIFGILSSGARHRFRRFRQANPGLGCHSLISFSPPSLGTASGVIPASWTRRSFCFLRLHPKNFARFPRPKSKILSVPHRMQSLGPEAGAACSSRPSEGQKEGSLSEF